MSRNYNVDDILDEIQRKKSEPVPAPRRVVVTKTEDLDARFVRRAVQSEPVRRKVADATPPRGQKLPPREEKLRFGRNVRQDLEELEIEPEDDEPRSVSIGSAAKKQPIRQPQPKPPRQESSGRAEGFKLNVNFDDDADDMVDSFGKTQMNIPIPGRKPPAEDGHTRLIKPSHQEPFYEPPHEEPSYKKGREKKISQFVLNTEPVPEPIHYEDDEDTQTGEVIDDYNKPSDRTTVAKDIGSIKLSLCIRFVLTLLLLVTSVYLTFSYSIPALPLPPFMFPETDLRMFIGVNLACMVLAILICNTTIGGGLISLFTMKADNDSPIAIASMAAIAGGVALVISPDALSNPSVHFYFAIVILGLVLNTIGKLFMIGRIGRNFRLVSSEQEKQALLVVKSRDLAKQLMRSHTVTDPTVVYDVKADFLSQFLDLSYSEDNTENISRIATPILTIFALVASIATYFFNQNIYIALTAFTAMLCICAPFTSTMIGNLPLSRAAKSLTKQGAMISGYSALENFSETDALIVKDSELFDHGAITLHGIKAFAQERIDEAILDAASVICSCNGILTEIFMQMIGSKVKLLKKVDSIVYEDGMGISAWVAGKRVLIGNRELMTRHDVDAPSKDYEAKFVRDGREVLYIANSGELTAMFVVSYNGSIDIIDELKQFSKKGISLIVYSNDSNITAEKISSIFGYPEDLVRIMPSKLHGEYESLAEKKPRAKAEIAYSGNLAAKLQAIKSVVSTKNAITIGSILQLIGVFLGYALVVFFAFTGSMSVMNFEALLIFQLFFTFLTLLIPNLRKY